MTEFMSGVTWFDLNIRPFLGDDFELTYIHENGGDLGDLSGVQFDSNRMGGYVYFWSLGYVSYQLVDYEKEIELVEDATEEVLSKPYDEIFKSLMNHISQLGM